MRTHLALYQEMVHKGSVNCLKVEDGKIITGSADNTLRIFSLPSMKSIHKIDVKDMILAMETINDLTIIGTGKGNIIAYDNVSGGALYGYGVMKKGGCRLLGINKNKNRLVCAGEDDNAIVLTFS